MGVNIGIRSPALMGQDVAMDWEPQMICLEMNI